MSYGRKTTLAVTFVTLAVVVEAVWLASLHFLLDQFGGMALAGTLVAALGAMVAVLDASPVAHDPRDGLNLP